MIGCATHLGLRSGLFFVDDADAQWAHARARAAHIFEEPGTHDYGEDYWSDRSYGARDQSPSTTTLPLIFGVGQIGEVMPAATAIFCP